MARLALVFALWLACPPSAPASVLVIVSERSAPDFVSALAPPPGTNDAAPSVEVRSVTQFDDLTDSAKRGLMRSADVVVLLSVFGEPAERLVPALAELPPSIDVFGIGGDLRITRATRFGGERPLAKISAEDAATIVSMIDERVFGDGAQVASLPRFANDRALARWAALLSYWRGRGDENLRRLIRYAGDRSAALGDWEPAVGLRPVRWRLDGEEVDLFESGGSDLGDFVVVVDYETGDREVDRPVLERLCGSIERRGLRCVGLLARWGSASASGVQQIDALPGRLRAIIVLQDFVIGGGEAREEAAAALQSLDVPVLKAIRVRDRSFEEWSRSADGIAATAVHYQVGMPEVQGVGQPHVVAVASEERTDPRSGGTYRGLEVVEGEIEAIADRIAQWRRLQDLANAEKRVAVVYYNHPPGRHNIGADNLDVPSSLLSILETLRDAGYRTGELPSSSDGLLKRIQSRGVNLPENAEALAALAKELERGDVLAYGAWMDGLPAPVRMLLTRGPLASLEAEIVSLSPGEDPAWRARRVERALGDVRSLIDGTRHPARARALDLLGQLSAAYAELPTSTDIGSASVRIARLTRAIEATGIEGVRGWGEIPGDVMTHDGRFVLPGVEFGNVIIAPQPPRGWELHDELLHANVSFPPPHQYLEFYRWLREDWKADAIVHVGRHSTYEFLPGPAVALARHDFPRLVIGNLPSIYLYIVDGVGEGTQAKRRGQAVIVDHLTPSMESTALYDELLELRQLIESFEAAAPESAGQREALVEILARIERLELRSELESSMAEELRVRGTTLEDADPDLLVHEVGHYLTELQERFMAYGLHVFGRDWPEAAIDRMVASMVAGRDASEARAETWRGELVASPRAERESLLAALDGRFVAPGTGNDPIRSPDVLPTGRNFHGLDGRHLPTRVAYTLGRDLADEAAASVANLSDPSVGDAEKSSVVLWASDTVRDEGVMVAFGLRKLGLRPVWTARGLVGGVERLPLEAGQVREDVVFVTSGLFRDLFANLLDTLDRAVLYSLDASSVTIAREAPDLVPALEAALAPLGGDRDPGEEPLERNGVAANWVRDTRTLANGPIDSIEEAGRSAALRIFGAAPGRYGAGINRAVERSGSWSEREELARIYSSRLSFGYRGAAGGAPAPSMFELHLAEIDRTYLGRASHLYGLLDNNDGFDYLGGLSIAVEAASGTPPASYVVDHASVKTASVRPLERALLMELRGTHLNPRRLVSLMDHGYAGARTMNQGFVENLWGWQATTPSLVRSWVWDEVYEVFLEDRHQIGLDAFLDQPENAPVRINMIAILLVAAQRGYWEADDPTVQSLAEELSDAVTEYGLPGSGHTAPDHPLFDFVAARLDATRRIELAQVLERAHVEVQAADDGLTTLREVEIESNVEEARVERSADSTQAGGRALGVWLILILLAAFAVGVFRGTGRGQG